MMFITTLDVLVKIKYTQTQCKLADVDTATEMKVGIHEFTQKIRSFPVDVFKFVF